METIRKWFTSPERSFVRKLIYSPSSSTERVDCDEDGAGDEDDDVSNDVYVQWCQDLQTAETYSGGFMDEVIDLDPGEVKLILVASQISVEATAADATTTTTYVPGRIKSAEGEKEVLSNNEINTQHTDPPMWHVDDIWGVISLPFLNKMQVQNLFSTHQLKDASERNQCQFHHHPPSNYNDKLSPPRLSNQSTTRWSSLQTTSQSQSTIIPSDTDLSFFPTQSHMPLASSLSRGPFTSVLRLQYYYHQRRKEYTRLSTSAADEDDGDDGFTPVTTMMTKSGRTIKPPSRLIEEMGVAPVTFGSAILVHRCM